MSFSNSNAENKYKTKINNFNILVKSFEDNGYKIEAYKNRKYQDIKINSEKNIDDVIISSKVKNIYIIIKKYKASNKLNPKYLEKIDNYKELYLLNTNLNKKYLLVNGLNLSYELIKKENNKKIEKDFLLLKIYYKNVIFEIVGPASKEYKKLLKIFLKGIKKFGKEEFINSYGNYFVYTEKDNLSSLEKIFINLEYGIFILKIKDINLLLLNLEKILFDNKEEFEKINTFELLDKKYFSYFKNNYKIISEKKELNNDFVEKLVDDIENNYSE